MSDLTEAIGICSCWTWYPSEGDINCTFEKDHEGSHSFQIPELDSPARAEHRQALREFDKR